MMHTLWQDVRYGARMLMKNRIVSGMAVITLAIGIGANTATFSVVNAVMLRSLPYKNPDRLMLLWADLPGYGRWRTSPGNFLDWKKQNTIFEDIAAFNSSSLTISGDGEPEQMIGANVSAGYFTVVGVQPMLGRLFLPEEYEAGKNQVVILGNAFWHSRYGGNRNLINKEIMLDGRVYIVVGVMPAGIYPVWSTTSGRLSFDQSQQQFWLPMAYNSRWAADRNSHVLGVVGRLKPNITLDEARAAMNILGARLEHEDASIRGERIIVNSFMDEVVGDLRPALLTLLGAVGLVLLIACANITGLLLAQYAARRKEIAIRAALGAGRTRLMRQFFLEGLLLALLGATLAIVLGKIGMDALVKIIPSQVPRLNEVRLDSYVFVFTFILSLVTCLLIALVPAWQATKPNLQSALDQGGRASSASGSRRRFRELLIVFQVSVAVMLVIGAGLLIKSFWHLHHVDPGFRADNVLAASVTLSPQYHEAAKIISFYNQLMGRISALPGVDAAAIAYDHPLDAKLVDTFKIEGRTGAEADQPASANFEPVSWDYFRTVGTTIISGRSFTPQDDQDNPGVVIVNEAFVRQYLPHEKALGRRIQPARPAGIWNNERFTSFEIVGIAQNIKSIGRNAESEPTYYAPATQAPLQAMTILVHSRNDPTTLVSALRDAVWTADPNQAITNISTLEKAVSDRIAQPRLNMLLVGLFGALALVLAAVGIYALLSYFVTERTKEIGIRMALGGQFSDVVRLILKQGMILAVTGETIGFVGAVALTRLIRGLLFGVAPTDVKTFILVGAVVTSVALLASYFPARRAAKIDPLVALRYE